MSRAMSDTVYESTLTACLLRAGAVPTGVEADGTVCFSTDLDTYETARADYMQRNAAAVEGRDD